MFAGPNHEGMGGVLERTDLIASFAGGGTLQGESRDDVTIAVAISAANLPSGGTAGTPSPGALQCLAAIVRWRRL